MRAARSALAEALEWVGDAVVGELTARVLLAHFHASPLSARVFRSLLLSVVSNRNLALVCDRMGYAPTARDGKEKADIVEAVVGELTVRLMREQRRDPRGCAQLRSHLDTVLAATLRTHFDVRTRAQRLGAGPLAVSRNPFACLPEEQLDDVTGEIVVLSAFGEEEPRDKSVADLIDEYADMVRADLAVVPTETHHAFASVSPTADSADAAQDDADNVVARTHAAMEQLGDDHVLRASKDVFEVFKVYGMTVLSERVSLALAQPHLLHPRALDMATATTTTTTLDVTPAGLTRQRQHVLSMANLARCGAALGVSSPRVFVDRVGGDNDSSADSARRVVDERLRANTLRAFVGFHSAVATTTTTSATTHRSSALVNDICQFLRAEAVDTEPPGDTETLTRLPDREPLVSLTLSLREAKAFMSSATCDALHQPGERPIGAGARVSSRTNEFLLRQCDSEVVEDLFETLAKEHERETRRALVRERADKARQTTRRKAARATASNSSSSGATGTAPLAPNLARFRHRRFLFCLEEIVVLFAQRQTDACRQCIASFERELEPCATSACFRKWEVSTSTLTLAMRDSFYRLLLHDVCQFHAVASSSKTTRDGTRVTQLRLPLHYSWAKGVARRITTELHATA